MSREKWQDLRPTAPAPSQMFFERDLQLGMKLPLVLTISRSCFMISMVARYTIFRDRHSFETPFSI